jgi:hypothetical protein
MKTELRSWIDSDMWIFDAAEVLSSGEAGRFGGIDRSAPPNAPYESKSLMESDQLLEGGVN